MLFLQVQHLELALHSSIIQHRYTLIRDPEPFAQISLKRLGNSKVLICKFAQNLLIYLSKVAHHWIYFISLHYGIAIVMPINDQLGLGLSAAK